MRKIFLTLFILLLIPSVLYAEDISGLSLEECLTLALLNHPSLTKAKASVRDITAQLEALRASNRWKLSLSGSLNYDGDYEDWDSRYHSESLRISATKLLYDNGRSKLQREIRTESLKGSRETLRNTQITVAANAKKAYYDLVLRMLNRDVEREKVSNLEEHLKRAEGFYEVGNVAFIEVTKAQADVASARVSLLKAENDILVSQEALRVAMGTDIAGPFDILLSTELLLPQPAEDTNALIASALNDRPDYRKILHDIRGSELAITNAARANSPTINGTVSSAFSKREGNNSTENYSAGITVTIPVVDGGEVKANVESARAQLDSVNADAEALRQQITYSVRSAALSLTNATDRVRSAEASVKYAEDNLELAKGRYEVGVGEPLELSDAVSTLASSRYTYYQALYDAQTARAELDAALGHFPPEIDGRIQDWEAE